MRKGNRRLKIMSLISAMLLMSGCSKQTGILFESGHEEKTEVSTPLTFFGFKEEALNVLAIEDILHRYMDQHADVSITYEGIKGTDYFDVLMKRVATSHADDIFMVDQAVVLKLEKKQKFADLSGIATADDFSDQAKSQMYSEDGKLYYVPTSISAFGLYCNEDLLHEHGQKIPENLKEFQKICDYFVNQGITPIVANNDISLKTIVLAKGMYDVYQRDDIKAQLQAFNRGERDLAQTLQPGFELVETMLQRGYIDQKQTLKTEKTKDDLVQFAKGESPFMLSGAWASPRLKDLDPAFTYSIHPYPILEDGSVLVMNIDTRIAVNASSKYKEEAIRFVEYMTQKDVMWEFVNSQSSFSPLKDERIAEDETIQSIGPYLNNGRSIIGADDNLDYPIWNLTRECVRMQLENESSDAVVAYLDEQLKAYRNGDAYEK